MTICGFEVAIEIRFALDQGLGYLTMPTRRILILQFVKVTKFYLRSS